MEDQTLLDAMDEIEDDFVLVEATDLIERQLAYGEQRGGGGPLLDLNVCPIRARTFSRNIAKPIPLTTWGRDHKSIMSLHFCSDHR